MKGSFTCECNDGFVTSDGGVTCNDVDECDRTGKERVCDNASCQNSDEFHYRKTSMSLLNKHFADASQIS